MNITNENNKPTTIVGLSEQSEDDLDDIIHLSIKKLKTELLIKKHGLENDSETNKKKIDFVNKSLEHLEKVKKYSRFV